MSNPNEQTQPTPDAKAGGEKQMTAVEAAKAVKRPVTELVDGKDAGGKPAKVARVKLVAVSAEEVLSFKDYGEHVVVVTKDGQKFSSADA